MRGLPYSGNGIQEITLNLRQAALYPVKNLFKRGHDMTRKILLNDSTSLPQMRVHRSISSQRVAVAYRRFSMMKIE